MILLLFLKFISVIFKMFIMYLFVTVLKFINVIKMFIIFGKFESFIFSHYQIPPTTFAIATIYLTHHALTQCNITT